jgi:hypothetical protein
MPRSSSRSKFNRGAIKQPSVSATSTEKTEALGDSWFEAKLLLKRVPESDSAWKDLCEVTFELDLPTSQQLIELSLV